MIDSYKPNCFRMEHYRGVACPVCQPDGNMEHKDDCDCMGCLQNVKINAKETNVKVDVKISMKTQGDIKLGNLSDDEIGMIKDLIKYFSGREIDVCLKKHENDYYLSVPIYASVDGPIYIDQRITETIFVFDDLCMPDDLISIKFLRDTFVSSSFKRSFFSLTKDYTEIFYTDSSNKLHDCKPHPFEFPVSLYEIYPNHESKYEVPENVIKERMDVSKSFCWYLHSTINN